MLTQVFIGAVYALNPGALWVYFKAAALLQRFLMSLIHSVEQTVTSAS